MKYLLILFFMLYTAELSKTSAFADTIIQGNAQSNTSVTTNVQGSGSVSTHIESTVNGITKTLDSNKPGTYTLGNNGQTSSNSEMTNNPSTTNTPTSTPTPKSISTITSTRHTGNSISNAIGKIEKLFHAFVQKILLEFRL